MNRNDDVMINTDTRYVYWISDIIRVFCLYNFQRKKSLNTPKMTVILNKLSKKVSMQEGKKKEMKVKNKKPWKALLSAKNL